MQVAWTSNTCSTLAIATGGADRSILVLCPACGMALELPPRGRLPAPSSDEQRPCLRLQSGLLPSALCQGTAVTLYNNGRMRRDWAWVDEIGEGVRQTQHQTSIEA